MANSVEVLTAFLASLKSGEPRADLLSEDAKFQALNVERPGRDEVLKRMSSEPTGKVFRDITWQTPQAENGVVKVKGVLPAGAPLGGVILTVHFTGDRISTIQQQGLPGAPGPASEVKLTAKLKAVIDNSLASKHPMLIAHCDESGQPVMSFRGSIQTLSDDQLAIWVRNPEGSFARSIKKNPKVALVYRDEEAKSTYHFQGRAHISSDEAIRERVYATMAKVERDHDFAEAGVVMVIDLDFVQGYAGFSPTGLTDPVRMARSAK